MSKKVTMSYGVTTTKDEYYKGLIHVDEGMSTHQIRTAIIKDSGIDGRDIQRYVAGVHETRMIRRGNTLARRVKRFLHNTWDVVLDLI